MSSSKYQFNQLLAEQDNFLDTMLSFIPNIRDNKHSTAAEWVLHALFEKYEEQFVLITIKKGVALLEQKMMDAPTISAMLEDCIINSTNARKLFYHLSQFFSWPIAISERL